jgi:hypothetical protein
MSSVNVLRPFGFQYAVHDVIHEAIRNPVTLAPNPFGAKTQAFRHRAAGTILDAALHLDAMDPLVAKQMADRGARGGGPIQVLAVFGDQRVDCGGVARVEWPHNVAGAEAPAQRPLSHPVTAS